MERVKKSSDFLMAEVILSGTKDIKIQVNRNDKIMDE